MTFLQKIFRHTEAPEVVVAKVEEEVRMGAMYIFLLFTATILSLFGIITSNTSVVIGSMIIAPLAWPIMGFAVGVAAEKHTIIWKSVLNIILSTIFVVGLSYVLSIGFLSSSLSLNNEILSRITPTLYDLIIALAVGFVAAVSLSWSKISEAVAGVAIASSLLPPLSVTGVGFAMQNWEVISGSLLLFVTNAVSIVFAGLVLFMLQGYYRVSKESHVGIITISFVVTIGTIIALGAHLTLSLSTLIQERSLVLQSEKLLQTELSQISPQLMIDNSIIRKEQTGSGTIMNIRADVTAPQDVAITLQERDHLIEKLKATVGLPINLDIRFIPSLKVLSEDVVSKDNQQRIISQIEHQVGRYFQVLDQGISVDSVRVWLGAEGERARIVAVVRVPDGDTLGLEQTIQLKNALSNTVGKELDLEVQVVKTYELKENKEPSEEERVEEYLKQQTEAFVGRVSSAWQMKIEVLDVAKRESSYVMSVLIYAGNKVNLEEKLEFYKKTILEESDILSEDSLEIQTQIVEASTLEL